MLRISHHLYQKSQGTHRGDWRTYRGDGQYRQYLKAGFKLWGSAYLPKTKRAMPNIYYCNGLANNDLGTLRVVLSWEECRNLLKLCSVEYAGLQFPTLAQGRASVFAVLRILDEERGDEWQGGFYTFDGDILQIEEWVQTCIRSRNPPPGRKLAD